MDALIAMADAGAKESSRPPSTSPLAEQEQIASVSILLQILMLGLAFVLGHILRRHKFYYLHEASASLLIGIFAGVIANISNTEERFRYLGGVFFLMYKLTFQESLIFGSLISATDPVTVLGIFQELGSDVNLYALVFGESVLNDAVAISLYRLANLECCMIVLFPYAAYMLAEGVGLSGIVAILFCGILMKHYTFSNLSESAQTFTTGFFHLISSLAETFVAANVFPSAYIVNYFRSQEKQIPDTHQKALWFAGLRGAMAFALALQSVHDLPPGVGRVIVTTTTAIVVLTVLVIGGATSTMLEKLDVVGDNHDGPQNHGETLEEENERLRGPSDEDDGSTSPTHNLKMKLRQFRRNTNFSTIDKNFLKPFFTVDKEEKMLPTAVETANGSTQTSNGQPRTTHHPNTSTDDRDRRQPSSNVGVQIDPRSAERSRQTSSNVSQFKDSRQRSLSPLERTTTSQEGRPPYKSRPSL
ncbi:hypothetical protein AXG93_1080s1010 [Marchantia polymorpha subsp. ruderalis]|uniref:Cation/H+ exchanger transmembrane domain-containing protein n=1 Tax=Marchantia polymorpha subsp. ruderalis TaxID=1480154 RepID=A0A176W5F4_MARPO|nr:hypothetical protein AXG93_1080s1010 [Marchantia polymorpha subsp. ruderalis]